MISGKHHYNWAANLLTRIGQSHVPELGGRILTGEPPEKERCCMSRLCCTIGRYSLTVAMLVLVLFSRPAQAEWYVAAQGGAFFAGYFDHITGTSGAIEGLNLSQLGLQSSPPYGGKVGYYLDEPGWQ